MVKLYPVPLTEARRPVLVKGEVERAILDKVDLRFDGAGGVDTHPSDEYRDGYVVLTNYRLIWMTTKPPELPFDGVPCGLPLGAVAHIEHKPGRLIKHTRLKLSVRVDAGRYPATSSAAVEGVTPLKLICKGSSPDAWRTQLDASLARAAWAALPAGVWQEMLQLPAAPAAGSQPLVPSGGSGGRPGLHTQPSFEPDPLLLHELCSMGFLTQQAANALLATGNSNLHQAIEWLLAHQGSEVIDYPTPHHLPLQQQPQQQLQQLQLGPPGTAPGAALKQQQQQQLHARQRSLGSVGVAGVLRREEARAAATEHSLDQAFQDLEQLMGKAQEMVALAEYFHERVATRHAGAAPAAGDAPGEEGEELDAETALDLLNLGIVSPVTKESAGGLYHQELSRQLADFLGGPVARAGGLMPLPDAYCLFNRARGTELVSPDDLLQAVQLFPRIGAALSLREFASGVKVVQAATYSDDRVCEQLHAMVQPGSDGSGDRGGGWEAAEGGSIALGGSGIDAWVRASLGPPITQTEAAAALHVPLAVASEQLLMAEARGVLCRDESGPEGLRFYRNFFCEPVR